jgi:alginate O-acetyltransferase complex protein AlgJ
MNSEATIKKLHAVFETLTIVAFLALLWLPTLDHFFQLDHARKPIENRAPAAWPQFAGIGQSRDFVTGVESYFNDRFGFRNRLIRWNHHWKDHLFHDTSGKDVLIGRDRWLFYSGGEMLQHWTREASFSGQDLENWRRLLELRRDWLRERGSKYIFVVPPDKHTVYPEYLPGWMEKSPKPSKVQQLVEYMKAHSTVEVLDLSPTLLEAKKLRADYLKTDTHWNLFGGFMGYRALMQSLARQMPGLEPLPLDAYNWKPLAKEPGDLTVMLGRTDGYTETQALEPVAKKPLPTLEGLFDPVRLPQGEAKEFKSSYTLNDKASGKAIVFRDSFAGSWYPFLGQHFREVIYIWHYDWDRPLIEREKTGRGD